MDRIGIIDFRDEFYVKLFRGWVVISLLSENIKFKKGVPIGKAAVVNFLLCNPSAQQKFLSSFGKTQQLLKLDDFLYRDNIEFGGLQDGRDFAKTCSLLIKGKYASFERLEGEVILHSLRSPLLEEVQLTKTWKREIDQLLPLMGKSLNVLHNSILKASNGI